MQSLVSFPGVNSSGHKNSLNPLNNFSGSECNLEVVIVAKECLQNQIVPNPHLCLLLKTLTHLDNFQQPRKWGLHIYPIKTNLSYISKKIWGRNNSYHFFETPCIKKRDDQWKVTFDGRQSVKVINGDSKTGTIAWNGKESRFKHLLDVRWVLDLCVPGKSLGCSGSMLPVLPPFLNSVQHCVQTVENYILTCLTL